MGETSRVMTGKWLATCGPGRFVRREPCHLALELAYPALQALLIGFIQALQGLEEALNPAPEAGNARLRSRNGLGHLRTRLVKADLRMMLQHYYIFRIVFVLYT